MYSLIIARGIKLMITNIRVIKIVNAVAVRSLRKLNMKEIFASIQKVMLFVANTGRRIAEH